LGFIWFKVGQAQSNSTKITSSLSLPHEHCTINYMSHCILYASFLVYMPNIKEWKILPFFLLPKMSSRPLCPVWSELITRTSYELEQLKFACLLLGCTWLDRIYNGLPSRHWRLVCICVWDTLRLSISIFI
jgi:hypothetical protein